MSRPVLSAASRVRSLLRSALRPAPSNGPVTTAEQPPVPPPPPAPDDADPALDPAPPEPEPVPAAFDPAAELSELSGVWDSLARTDPLWAILSEPDKRGRRWQLEEFFEEGRREIDELMATLEAHGVARPNGRSGAALDFGCGIGRLSRRLAHYFDEVTGVDIAPTMVELARRLDTTGGRARYVVNQEPHLRFLPDASLDLLYSNIVLQHMAPELAVGYITEFFRVVRPGGSIVFQIPSHISEAYLPEGWTETPLEIDACSVALEAVVPDVLSPGASVELDVRVVNTSPRPWLQRRVHQLNLGNHWLTADRGEFRHNDGRTRLPARLGPGEAAIVPLTVTAPDQPGAYLLELDVVQEGVRWFSEQGGPALTLPVVVTDASPAGASPPATSPGHEALVELYDADVEPATFKMAGVPRDDIVTLIAELGGELLHADEHISEWYSYKYFVRRCEPSRMSG